MKNIKILIILVEIPLTFLLLTSKTSNCVISCTAKNILRKIRIKLKYFPIASL